jgi:CheY-like chemotaxis protein
VREPEQDLEVGLSEMPNSAADSATSPAFVRGMSPPARSTTPGGDGRGKGRVLLADDSHVARTFVSRLLELSGYVVDVACDGRSGALAVCTGEYDLVLLDLQMPGMNGTDAAAVIRAAGLTVPIIALTASTDSRDPLACAQAGMNGFLCKPFTMAAFEAEWERVRSVPVHEAARQDAGAPA